VLLFYVAGFCGKLVEPCGIACCYAQFKVPLSWELSVAVYPELVEGSLTCTFKSYSAILSSDTLITTLLRQAKLKPFRKKQNQSFRFLPASNIS